MNIPKDMWCGIIIDDLRRAKMDYPLISVLVLCHNSQKYLYENLKSIFCQTYPNIEVLISDDASDDFNGEQLVIWFNKNRTENIKKISVYENQFEIGEVASLEKLQCNSTGKYLFNISAKDVLFNENVLMNLYIKAQEIGDAAEIIISENEIWDAKLENKNSELIGIHGTKKIKELTEEQLFIESCKSDFIPVSYLYNRNLFKSIGLLSDRYLTLGNWVTILRVFRNDIKVHYCDDCTSVKVRNVNYKPDDKIYLHDWYEVYANEIEPFLDKLNVEEKESVQSNAENKFREYCKLLSGTGKANNNLPIAIACKQKKNTVGKISFKYKVSKFAYNIFSQKPFFILKKYIKQFGLKEFICKMSTKKAVVINAVISVLLLIGLCFSYLNNLVYANLIVGVLFLLWSSVTLGGVLLHYYLLNR